MGASRFIYFSSMVRALAKRVTCSMRGSKLWHRVSCEHLVKVLKRINNGIRTREKCRNMLQREVTMGL